MQVAVAIGATVALAGCGSSSSHSTTTTHNTSAPQPQAASQPQTTSASHSASPPTTAASSALGRHVLRSGELAGMSSPGVASPEKNLTAWVAGEDQGAPDQTAEVARLRKLGWKDALAENLMAPGNPNRYGVSLVEHFSSAHGAQRELAHQTGSPSPGGPWTYFAVSGIPGARGFEQVSSSQSGRNVAFADGSYYYLVGAGWMAPSSNAVSRAQLVAAAVTLFHRVHAETGG